MFPTFTITTFFLLNIIFTFATVEAAPIVRRFQVAQDPASEAVSAFLGHQPTRDGNTGLAAMLTKRFKFDFNFDSFMASAPTFNGVGSLGKREMNIGSFLDGKFNSEPLEEVEGTGGIQERPTSLLD